MENMAQDYGGQGQGNGPEELFAQQKVCAGGHSKEGRCTNPPLKSATLDREKLETRLLTLSSGEFHDMIQCNLNPVSLRANPPYIALSYCWGESDTRSEIEINGQKACVRESLATALKYLRRSRDDVVVWADAISINQEDADEKEYQIRMMGSIYSNASQAWVWLGESEDNSDDAMDLVKSLHKIDFDDSTYQPERKSWTALKRLFQRPWWGRLWVVQECLLAEKASVNCGKKVVDMESFVHLKQIEHKYRRSLDARLRPMHVDLQSPFGVILWDWDRHKRMIATGGIPLFQMLSVTGACKCAKAVDKIFGLLSVCTAEDRRAIPVDYDLEARDLVILVAKYHLKQRERHNPLQMLQTHQAKKGPSLPSWVPDYTTNDFEDHLIFPASKESVAFKAGANNAAWSAIASRVGNGHVRVFDLGIISTSDVIEALLLGARFLWVAALLFLASALHPFATISKVRQHLQISTLVSLVVGRWLNSVNLHIEDEGSHETLVLPGLIVDDVSTTFRAPFVEFYLGSDLAGDVENKRRRREEMKEACRQWEAHVSKLRPDADPYRETCGRREAFWRTLIADRDYYWRGPPPAERDFSGRFEAWMCRRDDSAGYEVYTRPFSDAAIVRCLYRSFIVTEKGYLGLGRNSTQPGDIVCVLRGGNVPFILRKKDDGYYELVGEAYVHGIMDGSFVRKSRNEELKEFRIR